MERDVKKFLRVVVLCGMLFVAACGGESQTATPNATPAATRTPTRRPVVIPTTPAGWTPYSRATYQIALPDAWQEIKLSEAELKSAISSAQENNPPLAEQLRALLEAGQYKAFVFYAVDKTNSANLQNVSIARTSLEGTNDLATYTKAYADALPNVVRGANVVQVQAPLLVNGMQAASIVYDISLIDNAGKLITLRGVQFLYLLESGDAYLVTVTGNAAEREKFMSQARDIATSFVGVTP